jgi:L-fucose mutarotase
MLKHELIHPKINEVAGRAGHSSKILIADGNYPASTTLGPKAELVSLNLSPGVVSCNQVLAALLSAVPVEKISVMQPNKTGPFAMENDPPVWSDYQATMKAAGVELELDRIERWDFYKEVDTPSVALVIQTADQNLWANILLTVGVRKP